MDTKIVTIDFEIQNLVREKIILDVLIHVLNKKIYKAQLNKEDTYYLEQIYKFRKKQLQEINESFFKKQIKVYPPERIHEIFLEYRYTQKIDGIYKDGVFTFWDVVLKSHVEKRLNTKGDIDGFFNF